MLSLHEYAEQHTREADYEARQERIERFGHPVELSRATEAEIARELAERAECASETRGSRFTCHREWTDDDRRFWTVRDNETGAEINGVAYHEIHGAMERLRGGVA